MVRMVYPTSRIFPTYSLERASSQDAGEDESDYIGSYNAICFNKIKAQPRPPISLAFTFLNIETPCSLPCAPARGALRRIIDLSFIRLKRIAHDLSHTTYESHRLRTHAR